MCASTKNKEVVTDYNDALAATTETIIKSSVLEIKLVRDSKDETV